MSTHRHINIICTAAVIVSLLLTLVFMNGKALGIQTSGSVIGYENRIFNTSAVHTIDIVMDDWDSFLETCENEEYSPCAVIIDGESYQNIGIRAKGNTSLSTVSAMNSDRYSFKLKFDQYESGKSYYGLDKLCLNNIIQDNTYMKDYLSYQLMNSFGVHSPLSSYAYLTVNGEDWGLYLAVEGVEDAFLRRNYGNDTGNLYKPDSMSFGGGRGNGRDFEFDSDFFRNDGQPEVPSGGTQMPMPDNVAPPQGGPEGDFNGGFDGGFEGFDFGGGMGSSDVKLQYIDDDPESYSNIFDSAKTNPSDQDKTRLIQSLKQLSSGENLSDVVDIGQVLRYFIVHNFVVNGDSYTGGMIHNYYLYEKEGQLSMIPWDYNLAFGTFTGGSSSDAVNDPIDEVLSDRPMQSWIFSDDLYTEQYHQLYREFLSSVDIDQLIEQTRTLIAPYVEKDPTKFCTYEEFQTGADALKLFCQLRCESVLGQLEGTIPATSEEQPVQSGLLVQADTLQLSDMGSGMMGGMGGGPFPENEAQRTQKATAVTENQNTGNRQPPDGTPPSEQQTPVSEPQASGSGQESPSPAPETESGTGPEPDPSSAVQERPGRFNPADWEQEMAQNEAERNQTATITTLVLLGVSVLSLLIGLFIASKFRA